MPHPITDFDQFASIYLCLTWPPLCLFPKRCNEQAYLVRSPGGATHPLALDCPLNKVVKLVLSSYYIMPCFCDLAHMAWCACASNFSGGCLVLKHLTVFVKMHTASPATAYSAFTIKRTCARDWIVLPLQRAYIVNVKEWRAGGAT